MPLVICPYCRAHLGTVDIEEAADQRENYYVCPDCDSLFPQATCGSGQAAREILKEPAHA